MVLSHHLQLSSRAVDQNFKRLTNQIYRLLPLREEKGDWLSPLLSIIEEVAGMEYTLVEEQELVFHLLCKLQGLRLLENDFNLYRKTIFDCLNIMGRLRKQCMDTKTCKID